MKLNPYLAFKGNCEEAINFYKDVLDGEIKMLLRFHDMPSEVYEVSDQYKDQVMHCTLEFHGCTLLAQDTIEEANHKVGSNFSLSVNIADDDEASAVYNSLLAGGHSIMPFENAFWGGKFGKLVDKFGIQWMVTSEHKPS